MHVTSSTLVAWVRDYAGDAPIGTPKPTPSGIDALIPRDAHGARDRGALRFAIELGARELGVKVDLGNPKASDVLVAACAEIKNRATTPTHLSHDAKVEELREYGLTQLENEALLAKSLVAFVKNGYFSSARDFLVEFADWFEPSRDDFSAAVRLCLKSKAGDISASHEDVQELQAAGLIDAESASLVIKHAYLNALAHVGYGRGGPDRLAHRQELVASLEPHVTAPITPEERDAAEKSAAIGTFGHAMTNAATLDASLAFVGARTRLFDTASLSHLYAKAAAKNLDYGASDVYQRVRAAALGVGCTAIDADVATAAASVKADLVESLTGERAPYNRNLSSDFKRLLALHEAGLVDRAELVTLLQRGIDIIDNPDFEHHYNDVDSLIAAAKAIAAAKGFELEEPRWRGR